MVPRDNSLGPVEIALSIMINSQVSGNTAEGIWYLRERINESLTQIPDVNLTANAQGADIPGSSGISRAISEMCGIPRVKLSTATKILHKKRPSLIPILDRIIESHYWSELKANSRDDGWGDYAVKLIGAFRRDLFGVQKQIHDLADGLAAAGTPLTECRILEVLMWATLSENGPSGITVGTVLSRRSGSRSRF